MTTDTGNPVLQFLRTLLIVLNAGLIACAIAADVLTASQGSWLSLAFTVTLSVVAVVMLPYFYLKTRPEGGPRVR